MSRDALCSNTVIRDGHEEPCERPAEGWRVDPEWGPDEGLYEVCRRHWRHPLPTGLADLIARRPELVGVGLARIDWLRRAAA